MPLRRLVAMVLLVLQVSGCHVWRPSPLTPAQTAQTERRIRVLLLDSSEVEIQAPWLRRDTLSGRRLVYVRPSSAQARVQPVPLDSVAVIRTRRVNGLAVALIFGLGAPIATFGLIALTCGGLSSERPCT